jgi:hypothetical protein
MPAPGHSSASLPVIQGPTARASLAWVGTAAPVLYLGQARAPALTSVEEFFNAVAWRASFSLPFAQCQCKLDHRSAVGYFVVQINL